MSIVKPTQHGLKDGRSATIRCPEAGDAAELLRHGKEMLVGNDFAGREADEFNFTVEQERELIELHRLEAGRLWLVAEHGGRIVGAIMFSTGSTRRLAHRGVLGMGVEPGWRGVGLGSLLMQRLLDWAEAEPGVEKVALAVFATNKPALQLYRKFGFIEEGRRLRELKMGPGRYVDDILMYRWVKPR